MTRPNLLFLYTDEQAFNTLAAYGNSRIRMPRLNQLAAESAVFDQTYVTQPVCTPSRSSLLTGLYPHSNGCTQNNLALPATIPVLPELAEPGAYATGHFGKWHLGDELFAQHGFQDWVSVEDNYNREFTEGRDKSVRSSYHHFLTRAGLTPKNGSNFGRGEAARLPEALSKPAFLADEASRFIRDHASRPFMLYVNFLEPHMPFTGPRDDEYPPDEIPLPPNFHHALSADQPLKARLLREHYRRNGFGLALETEQDWQKLIARYWGLCSQVDTHIGRILDTLDACGLRDNTLVVFTSDHGDMMGAHRLLAKCVMFQEAIRVPLLMRLPGVIRPRRIGGPVSHIDVVPTLLDLLGQSPAPALQGNSLRPLMDSPTADATGDVFLEWNGPNNGLGDKVGSVQLPEWMSEAADPAVIRAAVTDPVRTIITADGWKFNCSPAGEHELYDLNADPGETHNRYTENRTLARRLTDRLRAWQARTGDTVELPAL